jgi:hypothetical protein
MRSRRGLRAGLFSTAVLATASVGGVQSASADIALSSGSPSVHRHSVGTNECFEIIC